MSVFFLVYVNIGFSVVLGVRVIFLFFLLISGLVSAFGEGVFPFKFFSFWGVFLLGVGHFLFLFG